MKDGIYKIKDGSLTRLEAGKRVRYAKGDEVELTGKAAEKYGAALLTYVGPDKAEATSAAPAPPPAPEPVKAPAPAQGTVEPVASAPTTPAPPKPKR